MGNQGSSLDDDPSTETARSNFQQFDHSFNGIFHTSFGSFFANTFGEFKFQSKNIKINCKRLSFEIIEDYGARQSKKLEVPFVNVRNIIIIISIIVIMLLLFYFLDLCSSLGSC